MSIFITTCEEGVTFDADQVRRIVAGLPGISAVGPGDGSFSSITWSGQSQGAPVRYELTIDSQAIWADYLTKDTVEHLYTLSRSLPMAVDLIDDNYSFHIHLHQETNLDAIWEHVQAGDT